MLAHKRFHFIYCIVVILLIISLVYHYTIYGTIPLPYNKIAGEKNYAFYVNKAHDGMIKGVFFALILDGRLSTAIRNGAIYGTLNPFLAYIGIV